MPNLSDRALIRFQAVAAYLTIAPPVGQRHALRQQIAAKEWALPNGQPVYFTAETLRGWVRSYQRDGVDGLEDAARTDIGIRVLTSEQIEVVCELKRVVPARSIERIIEIAETLEKVPKGLLKRSTVHRLLASRGLSARPKGPAATDDLDRFEAAFPNDLWQSDMMAGPLLPDPDKPGVCRRAWLSAFLDDHARLLLAGRWSFKNDRHPLDMAFRDALRRHGRPVRVYYDNGGPYASDHMKQVVATVSKGAKKPIYITPGRPEGHGKIEALNRLIRSSFVAEVEESSITTLEALNEAFRGWSHRYNLRKHGETDEAPIERWRRHAARVSFIDEDLLHEAFRFRAERTTDKTGVFSLFGQRYQVGAPVARKKVQVRYDPDDLDQVDVWAKDAFQERVRPLSPEPNRRPKAPRPDPVDTPADTAHDAVNDWVELLRAEGRALPVAPDPLDEMLAQRRQLDDQVVALIEDHVLPEVYDEQRVRDFLDRFGPLDPTTVQDALALAIDFGGVDQHLDQLMSDLLTLQAL